MRTRLIEFAEHYWSEYLDKIDRATRELDEASLWWRPAQGSNSIANLMLHLEGNLSQWILSGLLGERIERRRGEEFSAPEGPGREELLARLRRVVDRCREAIRSLDAEELARVRHIQGYEVDGYQALFHAIEHMSYHAGQIVLLAKARLPAGVELEFYPQHRGE